MNSGLPHLALVSAVFSLNRIQSFSNSPQKLLMLMKVRSTAVA